jgi:DNA-binding transcriptional ArsR family regulator
VALEVDRTLAALADPARRAIVELLQGQPQRPSEVARRLAVSRPTLSRHLRVLREAGLLDERIADGDARGRLVGLRAERLAELRGWLDEVTGFWTAQLAAFQAHVERRSPPRPPTAQPAPRTRRSRSRR